MPNNSNPSLWCLLFETQRKPDIKNGQCLFKQTKTWPPLATDCSACLGVSPVIALAIECDNPNHTMQGEAGEGSMPE